MFITKFKAYLLLHGITITNLARDIEYTREFISDVVNGRRKPSKRTAKALSRYTHGYLTVDEILNIHKDRKKTKSNEPSH